MQRMTNDAIDTDMKSIADELESIVSAAVGRFSTIDDASASKKPALDKWSKKEELGHLVDSAVNNQQRFVRLQITQRLELPGYQQDDWVRIQGYQERPWPGIVELWRVNNLNLAWIIRRVDPDCLRNLWRAPDGQDVDLDFIIRDYLVHMRHHLDRILS